MIEITLQRFSKNKESTLGTFFIDCSFSCYTLEDEFRSQKVSGETRIPAGRYSIELRTVGGFHARYLDKYGAEFHKGMLQVMNVPGFEYILIHTGNTDNDTAGCVLVGDGVNNNQISDGFLSNSGNAYKRIYPGLRDELLSDGQVWLTVKDEGQMDV